MPQKKISLRIDGELVNALEGQTILEAAHASGKCTIPTLCFLEGLTPVGACRLCMVEVAGIDRLFPACTTPVQDGMSVITNSARLARYRRMTIELLLVERNHVCAVCVANGHCELQDMAYSMGITSVRFAYNFPRLAVDAIASALRARPQPLHPVHALRAHLRRGGRRARVGDGCARHPRPHRLRPEPEVGRRAHLHQLRQVRAGVSDRRARGERQGGGGDDAFDDVGDHRAGPP